MGKRAQQRNETKNKLLQAAEKIFALEGYTNASMDRIAEEAGFSKGTIYLYFKDKEELFVSVLEKQMKINEQLIKENINWDQPLSRMVEDCLHALTAGGYYNPSISCSLLMEFLSQAIRRDDIIHQTITDLYDRMKTLLSDIIREAQERGKVDPSIDPDHVTTLLIACVDGLNIQNGLSRNTKEPIRLTSYSSLFAKLLGGHTE